MAYNSSKRGFFRNALDAMIAAREKQAAAYVNRTLLMLDDETLRTNGYNRADLERKSHGGSYFIA